MKAALEDQLETIEEEVTTLTAQRDQLTLRMERTEIALIGLLDQFRAAAEEANRLQSSWVMRLLVKVRLLRPLGKRDVPENIRDALSLFELDASRPRHDEADILS